MSDPFLTIQPVELPRATNVSDEAVVVMQKPNAPVQGLELVKLLDYLFAESAGLNAAATADANRAQLARIAAELFSTQSGDHADRAEAAALTSGFKVNARDAVPAGVADGGHWITNTADNEAVSIYKNVGGVATLELNRFAPFDATLLRGYRDQAQAAATSAQAAMLEPRPVSLADSIRKRIIVPKGGVFDGGPAASTGAIKLKLPVGIDTRMMMVRLVGLENYGDFELVISGQNDPGQWNYGRARGAMNHSLFNSLPIRFGHDGTGACIWLGEVDWPYWAYPKFFIGEMFIGGGPVTEAWMGEWQVSLVNAFDTVTAGPVTPAMPVSGANVKMVPNQLSLAVGIGAATGSAPSNYNTCGGGLAGASLTTGFNNSFWGMQSGTSVTTGSANAGFGTQTLQYLTTGMQNGAFMIHALMSLVDGTGNMAGGAGAMEYGVHINYNTAWGTYAGRDNQGDRNCFFGNRAGMLHTYGNDQLYIANNEFEALIRGDFALRKLQVNGELTTETILPANDNQWSLGSPTRRFANIYAASGTINTSDERQKRDIEALPDAVLDAWAEVEWVQYRFIDGERLHAGLIAQRVHAVFARHGLDAFAWGLCCYDEWDEQRETIHKMRKVRVTRNIPVQTEEITLEAFTDANGKRRFRPVMPELKFETTHELVEKQFPTHRTRVVRAAGSKWGLRYTECLALEAALNRRSHARNSARLDALESEMAALKQQLAGLIGKAA